jgi:hypothetical protein
VLLIDGRLHDAAILVSDVWTENSVLHVKFRPINHPIVSFKIKTHAGLCGFVYVTHSQVKELRTKAIDRTMESAHVGALVDGLRTQPTVINP